MIDRSAQLLHRELKQLRKLVGAKERHIQTLNGLLSARKPAFTTEARFENVALHEIDSRIAALDPDDVIGHLELSARREDLKLQFVLEGRS